MLLPLRSGNFGDRPCAYRARVFSRSVRVYKRRRDGECDEREHGNGPPRGGSSMWRPVGSELGEHDSMKMKLLQFSSAGKVMARLRKRLVRRRSKAIDRVDGAGSVCYGKIKKHRKRAGEFALPLGNGLYNGRRNSS